MNKNFCPISSMELEQGPSKAFVTGSNPVGDTNNQAKILFSNIATTLR